MSEYEKRLDELTEMFEDNANNLTPLMVVEYMQSNGMLANSVENRVVPKITEANKIAVEIAEKIEPKLTEHEESFFIAEFVEYAKKLFAEVKVNFADREPNFTKTLAEIIIRLNNENENLNISLAELNYAEKFL